MEGYHLTNFNLIKFKVADYRPYILTLVCLVYDKSCQLARPLLGTINQNVRFQVEIYPEKYNLKQMQNDQLEGIIDFNMGNIGKTMPASKTISIEQIKNWL